MKVWPYPWLASLKSTGIGEEVSQGDGESGTKELLEFTVISVWFLGALILSQVTDSTWLRASACGIAFWAGAQCVVRFLAMVGFLDGVANWYEARAEKKASTPKSTTVTTRKARRLIRKLGGQK